MLSLEEFIFEYLETDESKKAQQHALKLKMLGRGLNVLLLSDIAARVTSTMDQAIADDDEATMRKTTCSIIELLQQLAYGFSQLLGNKNQPATQVQIDQALAKAARQPNQPIMVSVGKAANVAKVVLVSALSRGIQDGATSAKPNLMALYPDVCPSAEHLIPPSVARQLAQQIIASVTFDQLNDMAIKVAGFASFNSSIAKSLSNTIQQKFNSIKPAPASNPPNEPGVRSSHGPPPNWKPSQPSAAPPSGPATQNMRAARPIPATRATTMAELKRLMKEVIDEEINWRD